MVNVLPTETIPEIYILFRIFFFFTYCWQIEEKLWSQLFLISEIKLHFENSCTTNEGCAASQTKHKIPRKCLVWCLPSWRSLKEDAGQNLPGLKAPKVKTKYFENPKCSFCLHYESKKMKLYRNSIWHRMLRRNPDPYGEDSFRRRLQWRQRQVSWRHMAELQAVSHASTHVYLSLLIPHAALKHSPSSHLYTCDYSHTLQ